MFSAWRVAPKAIAVLASYEAEKGRCWTLAHAVDPLQIGLELGRGRVPSERAVFQRARQMVGRLLSEALAD